MSSITSKINAEIKNYNIDSKLTAFID